MRTVGFIDHPVFKITVFSWSEKYIVKIEAGLFEQSYKFNQADFQSWEQLRELFDAAMLDEVKHTFKKMAGDMQTAAGRFVQRGGLA